MLDEFWLNDADNGSMMPRLLLTDFALAQPVDKKNNFSLQIAGTPAYLAPERWQGQDATVQSEIYAFGIMVFEILTGSRPFKINAQKSNQLWNDWAIDHCQKPVPMLPPQYKNYQEIINNTLAKRVEKRYQNIREILMDLR